jgi:16S rRNA (adenine1518-N6/adenine1519-N6)-dimethyltransferase
MAHRPRKRFGQNFLHDYNVITKLLAHIATQPGQHWVEIGPGQGALTEPLLNKKVRLDIIELDRDLVSMLQKKYAHFDNLTIHSHDALKFDFSSLSIASEKLHIIGNLPYNISTPLLFHLLNHATMIADMHFMLQKEVVDRICAEPGNKRYGRLGVMMQLFYQTEHLFDVPPESFTPAPKVTSAIVKLIPHRQPPVKVHSIDNFSLLLRQAFSQRRKTLRNSLKNLISEAQFEQLEIDAKLRAENLTLEDYARLSNSLDK